MRQLRQAPDRSGSIQAAVVTPTGIPGTPRARPRVRRRHPRRPGTPSRRASRMDVQRRRTGPLRRHRFPRNLLGCDRESRVLAAGRDPLTQAWISMSSVSVARGCGVRGAGGCQRLIDCCAAVSLRWCCQCTAGGTPDAGQMCGTHARLRHMSNEGTWRRLTNKDGTPGQVGAPCSAICWR